MNTRYILVVEDEVLVGMDIVNILEGAGFDVVQHAATEEEALQKIEGAHWDAVVADANLNGSSIEQVVVALKQKRIPFVIVTGYERQNLPGVIGDAPLLGKPFRTNKLVQTVRELCAAP